MGWGGGGDGTQEIRKLDWLSCSATNNVKFNVEGIRSRSTSEKRGGGVRSWLRDKLKGGGGCTPQKKGEGVDGYAL